jgi:hypothetical protein
MVNRKKIGNRLRNFSDAGVHEMPAFNAIGLNTIDITQKRPGDTHNET